MLQTVYLMRHGQTVFNQEGRIQGWVDSPLTANGIAQAEAARDWFQDNGITFGAAYASTVKRAQDTLKIVTDQPFTKLDGLREWHFGDLEATIGHVDLAKSYGDYFLKRGGESQTQVQTRMGYTMLTLMQREEAASTLVVSHAGAIRNFMVLWRPEDETELANHLPNCGIAEYAFDGTLFHFKRVIDPVKEKGLR
ncbi:histidine phosphatase family protein [Lacticaseibacillus mingshuiensis]|uniref:histidine phosphatase family protein n=1 Tax=Lacticaseibacillus mingshuiensis TaxID=2799574 RepID=UPI0019435D5B|nr:histidine phosphatase family protein [Lacticaseibacillus mingshuiensis]